MPDYNFGTLIRGDCTRDYAQDNTVLGTFPPIPSFALFTLTDNPPLSFYQSSEHKSVLDVCLPA